MNAGEICNREVVVAYRAKERVPVGILTDRDT